MQISFEAQEYERFLMEKARLNARVGVLMQGLAYFAKHHDQAKAQEFLYKADVAAQTVKRKDLVRAKVHW